MAHIAHWVPFIYCVVEVYWQRFWLTDTHSVTYSNACTLRLMKMYLYVCLYTLYEQINLMIMPRSRVMILNFLFHQILWWSINWINLLKCKQDGFVINYLEWHAWAKFCDEYWNKACKHYKFMWKGRYSEMH